MSSASRDGGGSVLSRRSYRGLSALPAWGLYAADDRLIATIRASSATDARALFERHGMTGDGVSRVPLRAYAGIGSRQTPRPMLQTIERIAKALADARWVCRTGHAPGADQAFERGAGHRAEVYLPWPKFEQGAPLVARTVVDSPTAEAIELSSTFHPAWDGLSNGARMLHGRNAHQVLGLYLDHPVSMVLCWTPEGKGDGGTGQAIRIAEAYGVDVYDLAIPDVLATVLAKVGLDG